MNSACTKTALVPLVLAATWATAQADDFLVTVTPTSNLSNLRLFTERNTVASNASAVDLQAISSDLGPIAAGTTYSKNVSTSYGTSASFIDQGVNLNLSVLAVSADGHLVLSGSDRGYQSYASQFGTATGTAQSDALSAAIAGTLSVATKLYPATSQDRLNAASDFPLPETDRLFGFDANGTRQDLGTLTITPVPEPAPVAALALGGLSLVRRRRRLASCPPSPFA